MRTTSRGSWRGRADGGRSVGVVARSSRVIGRRVGRGGRVGLSGRRAVDAWIRACVIGRGISTLVVVVRSSNEMLRTVLHHVVLVSNPHIWTIEIIKPHRIVIFLVRIPLRIQTVRDWIRVLVHASTSSCDLWLRCRPS